MEKWQYLTYVVWLFGALAMSLGWDTRFIMIGILGGIFSINLPIGRDPTFLEWGTAVMLILTCCIMLLDVIIRSVK